MGFSFVSILGNEQTLLTKNNKNITQSSREEWTKILIYLYLLHLPIMIQPLRKGRYEAVTYQEHQSLKWQRNSSNLSYKFHYNA